MSRGQRVRIGKGVYRDRYGIAAVVTVGGRRSELRFLPETPLSDIREKMEKARIKLRGKRGPSDLRGTLKADAEHYKRQIKHLASWREAWCEVQAWITR